MKAFLTLLMSYVSFVSSSNVIHFDNFCTGHPRCYSVWDDTYSWTFWGYNDLAFWGMDYFVPPYVSWAETAAMAATFSLRFLKKLLGHKTSKLEWISASYILLALHSYSTVNDYFNCTAPNEMGSFAPYIPVDWILYNDNDIPFGFEPENWCDYNTYQTQLDNWNGVTRYWYDYAEFEDNGLTFEQLAFQFWIYGLHVTTTIYCPDITELGSYYFAEDKYICDPSTPGSMWGTMIIFGVMEDYDGIWYAAYLMEATSTNNRVQWIRPLQRYWNETLQYFTGVIDPRYY